MAENEQDTPQEAKEGQGEASQKPAISVPQEGKDAQAAPQADDFGPKQGETIEQYANRMRNEVGWRDQQLKRATRQKSEADAKAAKAAEIEAENQRLKALAEAGTKKKESEPDRPALPRQPVGAPADLKQQARFEVQVEKLGADLLEKHADEWRSAHANFERVGGVQPEFLAAVLDTDDPSYVMLQLGKNMNEYQRIMDLPEGRRRAALIKLGMEPGQQAAAPKPEVKKPSGAPPPTTGALPPGSAAPAEGSFDPDADCRVPLEQRATATGKYSSDADDPAWYARRLEQKRNSKGRPWSLGGRGT